MNKINITKNQFSDLINIVNKVFFPLTNFVTKNEFLEIVDKKKYKNKFFPLPIYFELIRKLLKRLR